jgi:tetratricopeptide (TPR) repeat protein
LTALDLGGTTIRLRPLVSYPSHGRPKAVLSLSLGLEHLARLISITQRIWRDPVGSKVLGSLGYAALSAVGGSLLWPLHQQNWVVSLILGMLAVEAVLAHVTLRKPSLLITTDPSARYYARRTRRIAGTLAVVLPIMLPALGWAIALEICKADHHTYVFVANFEKDDQAAHYRVTRTIFEHLRSALSESPQVVPELVGRSVSWDKDGRSALSWCQRQEKAILIWGDFDTTRERVIVTAHFRLLRGSQKQLQGWSEIRSPLGELESFDVQDDLAHEFAYGTLFILGITRLESSDFGSAIVQFTNAIKEGGDRNVNPALFYRAHAFFQANQYENAIADYSTILNHEPNYHYALMNRGVAYVAIGDFKAGYSDLTQAIASEPSNEMAYANRGSALYELKRYREALDDYNHAIQLEPRDPLAYMGRANVYDKMDDIDKALVDYDAAVQLARNNPIIYFNRAIALHTHHQDDLAIENMKTVLLLKPTVESYEYRGYLFLRNGHRAEAINDYRMAVRFAKTDSERHEVETRLRELGADPQ